MSPGAPARLPGRMGIGEVLRRLRDEFPDVTISKIRYLEAEGLVEPARTAAGYRKFGHADVERLRYVLAAQRDHYLPLKVIREHLDAIARGLEPPAIAGGTPLAPQPMAPGADPELSAPQIRLSHAELLANSGLDVDELAELQEYGLVRALPDGEHFGGDALRVAATVAALSRHGLEPRHLRIFKTAADREVGLIEQIVAPVARQRDDEATTRAADLRVQLARLTAQLHDALVSEALSVRE